MKNKEMIEFIEVNSISELEKKDFENMTAGWTKEEIEREIEDPEVDGDPDYVYGPDGDLACIFEVWYDKYLYINYCEDKKAIEAIYKYLNNENEDPKYKDIDWNWDTIKMEKGPGIYTVVYRGGSGYNYKGGFYKI